MKTLAVSIALVLISAIAGILHLAGVVTIPFTDIGDAILTGFIPVVITIVAFAALVIMALTLRNEAELRNRELDYKEAAAEVDAVRRQGELVNAIRQRLSADTGDSEEERQELATELVTAAERYYTVLRGFIRARPEIARLERDAIASYLAEAEVELRRLRADGSAAFEDIPIVSPFAVTDSPSEEAEPFDDDPLPPGNSIGDVLSEGVDNRRRRA